MAKRQGIVAHPAEYYRKMFENISGDILKLYVAEYEGKVIAVNLVVFYGETCIYLHGASDDNFRNVMAPYALHWAIIKRAKECGLKYYDLWGISDDQKSGWVGITRFKRGFGGGDVFAPGTFDLPVRRFWYSVYTLARRMRP